MLTATLWWYVYNRAFEQFKQPLLYTFTADVASNGRIITFTGYLIDFVNEYDPSFGLFYIIVGNLQQTGEQAFDIFAHITCFGEDGSIDNGERNLEEFGDGTCQ